MLKKNFSYLLSRCLAQTLISTLSMDHLFLHIYTWLHALWRIRSLRLALQHCCNTHHKPAVWSPPQELQLLSFLAVMSSDHHHLFVLFFTLIYSLWGVFLVPVCSDCWDWLFFFELSVYFCKTEKSCIHFTQTTYMSTHWLVISNLEFKEIINLH